MTTKERDRLLDNPDISYWLQEAIVKTSVRDPVDAFYDVKTLLYICEERLKKMEVTK